jgi:hypothetical protein
VRAVGEHIKLKKTQREKVHRERLRLFMRNGGRVCQIVAQPAEKDGFDGLSVTSAIIFPIFFVLARILNIHWCNEICITLKFDDYGL